MVAERAYIAARAARAAHGKSTLGAVLTKVHAETLGEGNGNIDSEEERNREITLSGVHLRVYKFAYATQMLRLGLISRLQRKIVGDLIMQGVTHGNSVSHRAPGSIGQCQTPGRVFKGKKMAGHMGAVQVTTQNLKVVKVDAEKGICLLYTSPSPRDRG